MRFFIFIYANRSTLVKWTFKETFCVSIFGHHYDSVLCVSTRKGKTKKMWNVSLSPLIPILLGWKLLRKNKNKIVFLSEHPSEMNFQGDMWKSELWVLKKKRCTIGKTIHWNSTGGVFAAQHKWTHYCCNAR